MSLSESKAHAVVIGGGFYGVNIALYLAHQNRGPVVLLEKEEGLLTRASCNNQARVHNGYHYPRSFGTAFRSRVNLPRFLQDWPSAVKRDFSKIYAIAKNNSKVTASQFNRFCLEIGAKTETAEHLSGLFDDRLVEQIFLVEEYVFDATKLASWAIDQLEASGVDIIFNANVSQVGESGSELYAVYECGTTTHQISAEKIFNCTYSGLNNFGLVRSQLKHEVAELALVTMPEKLKKFGITVMDGPFFSILPFPAKGMHSVSHVRFTPHFSWIDSKTINPYTRLDRYHKETRVDRMLRDISRYIPLAKEINYQESLFEVKTVLVNNESDDGRPILVERHSKKHDLYSILGGKIDNIYDVLERIEHDNR